MSESSGTPPDDEWVCEVCMERPFNSLKLEYELLPGNKVFLYDINGDIWLFCWSCRLRYHLKCVNNLPDGITAEELGAYYYCEKCLR